MCNNNNSNVKGDEVDWYDMIDDRSGVIFWMAELFWGHVFNGLHEGATGVQE